VRSALEWAEAKVMAADGVTKTEIARRLGINRRTAAKLVEATEPPSYWRASAGSMLDPLEPVLRKLIADWPEIKAPRVTEILRDDYGYLGSVDLVRKRLAALRPRSERAAQRTGYRPGQVLQVDWAEMPTRPKIAGRERRVYALICSLPFSGAATAHFTFDMTVESFLEGHVRAFEWLGGVPRECVYDNLRSAVARRERVDGGRDVIHWNPRFSQLRGHYAFHAHACTPDTPREKGSVEGAVRYLKTGFWPARRFAKLAELDDVYADWRDRVALPRRHATGRHIVADRLAHEREQLRPLPPVCFDAAGRRSSRVPADGYLKFGRCFYRAPEALVQQRVELRWDRDRVWIAHHRHTVAEYPRSYEHGTWQPAPRLRPEPPPVAELIPLPGPQVVPPALSDYAELCA
jgi:transposase